MSHYELPEESLELVDSSSVAEFIKSIDLDDLDSGNADFKFTIDGGMSLDEEFFEGPSPLAHEGSNFNIDGLPSPGEPPIPVTGLRDPFPGPHLHQVVDLPQMEASRDDRMPTITRGKYDEKITVAGLDVDYPSAMEKAKRHRTLRKHKVVVSFVAKAASIMGAPFRWLYLSAAPPLDMSTPSVQFGRDHFRRSMSLEIARRGLSQSFRGEAPGRTPLIDFGVSQTATPFDTPIKRLNRKYTRNDSFDDLGAYDYGFEEKDDEYYKQKSFEDINISLEDQEALSLLESLPQNGLVSQTFPTYEHSKSLMARVFQQLLWLANENRINLKQENHDILFSC